MIGAAWAWVDHLEQGGTTRWSQFRTSTDTATTQGRPLPGVAQLELARRVNLVAPGEPHPVVTRILAAGAPGRGPQDLPLAGAVPPSDFGPRPVLPREVPTEELVRVATGILAEELADPSKCAPRVSPGRRGSSIEGPVPRPRPWGRALRGPGASGTPRAGSWRTLRLPIAPLDALLYGEWVARAERGRVRPWPAWVKLLAESDRLPDPVDLPAIARRWDRAWWRRVELVAAPSVTVDANAVAVVRRVNTLLGLLADEPRRQQLVAEVVAPWLAVRRGPRLAVPEPHRDWLQARATRMAEQLADAGYRVREDLSVLAELDETSARAARMEDVLEVAIGILRDGWGQR